MRIYRMFHLTPLNIREYLIIIYLSILPLGHSDRISRCVYFFHLIYEISIEQFRELYHTITVVMEFDRATFCAQRQKIFGHICADFALSQL